jgi:hypothetical protein
MVTGRSVALLGLVSVLGACGSNEDSPKQPADPSAALTQSMTALRDAGCFHLQLSFEIVGNGKPTGRALTFEGDVDGDRVKGELRADDMKQPVVRIGKKVYQHTTPEDGSNSVRVDGWFENTFIPQIAAPGVLTLSEVVESVEGASKVTSEAGPKIGGKATTALKYTMPDGNTGRVLISGDNEGPPLRVEMTGPTAIGTMNFGPFGLSCSIAKPPKLIDLPSAYASAAAGQR